MIYVFVVMMAPLWDTDIWWHLRIGEWMVQNFSFPHQDMFSSIHPEREWKTFNWLFEVLIYGIHEVFGLFGIRVFFAVLVSLSFGLWSFYFNSQSKSQIASSLLLFLLLVLYADRMRIRPHLMNLPFEAGMLIFLAGGGCLSSWKNRMLFFLLAVTWSNVHNPCMAVGAAVVIGNAIVQLVISKKKFDHMHQLAGYMWTMGLSLLAIVCNPYGPSLLFAGAKNISPVYQAAGEGEWMPPLLRLLSAENFFEMLVPILLLIAFFSVVVIVIQRYLLTTANPRDAKLPVESFAAPLLLLAVSQTAMRFAYLSIASITWIVQVFDFRKKAVRISALTLILFMGIFAYQYQITRQGGARRVLENFSINILPDRNPEAASYMIRNSNIQGRIFTPLTWGGYLLWFAHPAGGVSADGRSNTTLEVLQSQNRVLSNLGKSTTNMIREFDLLGVDIVVLPKGAFPFDHWPREWIRVAYDPVSELFLRKKNEEDLNRVRKFLQIASEDPESVEKAATLFFGERYYKSMEATLRQMENDVTKESIHNRIEIEVMAGHDNIAIQSLTGHLQAVPHCIRAATELAQILHDEGHYASAWKLLKPAEGFAQLPFPTQQLMHHLRSHNIDK